MDRRDFLAVAPALLPSVASRPYDRSLRHITSAADAGSALPRLHDILGVSVHFIEPIQAQLDAVVRAGLRWVRTDLLWSHVERARGNYDFSGYDLQYEALLRNGLSAYAILAYGNSLYDEGLSPAPGRESYSAFLKFAQEAVSRYGMLVEAWELWNEPNTSYWKPQPEVQAYAALCRDVTAIVRKAAPSARVVAGATSGIDTVFLQKCAELGAFDQVDTVSVHPYREAPPETALSEMNRVEALLRSATGRQLRVIVGEWGYSTAKDRVPPSLQAAYFTRMALSNFAAGRRVVIWYDLVQDGDDLTNYEHNFGIVKRVTLAALPTYNAASTLSQLLGDATFIDADVRQDGGWLLRLDKRGLPAAALWASTGSISRTVQLGGPAIAFDTMGNQVWRTKVAQTQAVNLDPKQGPIYVIGTDVRVRSDEK